MLSAYVFGRDDSYWYRLYQSLGRFSIVGTTVKDESVHAASPGS